MMTIEYNFSQEPKKPRDFFCTFLENHSYKLFKISTAAGQGCVNGVYLAVAREYAGRPECDKIKKSGLADPFAKY